MYAITSKPFVNFTLAILRKAEFGFFGVMIVTLVQTPRFCGHPRAGRTSFRFRVFIMGSNAGAFPFRRTLFLGFLMS